MKREIWSHIDQSISDIQILFENSIDCSVNDIGETGGVVNKASKSTSFFERL